jgi:hypothetical protein
MEDHIDKGAEAAISAIKNARKAHPVLHRFKSLPSREDAKRIQRGLESDTRERKAESERLGAEVGFEAAEEPGAEGLGELFVPRLDVPAALEFGTLDESEVAVGIEEAKTALDNGAVGEDLLAQFARRRFHSLSATEILKELFQAREVDPRLQQLKWLATALADARPECASNQRGFARQS